MNLVKILQMFGVNVKPEHIKAAEELIPKLPGLVEQTVSRIDSGMNNFDQRIKTLETRAEESRFLLAEILQEVRLGRHDDSDTRPAGAGATQLAIERGEPVNGNGN